MNIATDVVDMEAVYYIAGPMTGLPEYNYPYFQAVATRLRAFGFEVESPHENPWPECINPEVCGNDGLLCMHCDPVSHETYKWGFMMEQGAKQLARCDAIVLLPGWTRSRGAKKELTHALDHNWPVYFYLDPPGRLVNMTRMQR